MSAKSFSMTCDDEEFVSCQICFMNFDEKERVPKFLEKCYHFFCLPCIKDLIGPLGRKKVSCPTCRSSSTLSKRRCENLATNHVALRLLKVVEAQEKANKEKTEQLWCSDCNSLSSMDCQQNKHKTLNYPDAFNEHSLQLSSKIHEQHSTWVKVLENWNKIQSVNQLVLSCAAWLQSEFSHRNASNNSLIAQIIESLNSSEEFPVQMEKDMVKTLNNIEELKVNISSRTEAIKVLEEKFLDVLNSLNDAKQESEYLAQLSSDISPSDMDTWIKMLNVLNLETPTSQGSLKFCVKVLAFVFTLLSGELHNTESSDSTVSNSSNSSKKSSGNNQCNGDVEKNPERYPCAKDTVPKVEETEDEESLLERDLAMVMEEIRDLTHYEPLPSCSGTQQIFKRMAQDEPEGASLSKKSRGPLSTKIDVSTEMEKKSLSSKACQKMCFFKFMINGEASERVIIKMNEDMAPVMAAKFIELCTGTLAPPGYLGSKVFPHEIVHNHRSGSKSIPSMRGGQIDDHENFLFIADVSSVPAKLGSILFTVQEENDWGTLVSPDFQILLADPQWDTNIVNTIFGHVVVGFNVLDRISKIQLTNATKDFVTIVECGVI